MWLKEQIMFKEIGIYTMQTYVNNAWPTYSGNII